MATVTAIALTNLVLCGDGGTARDVEKGQEVQWPAFDAERAAKNGLIRLVTAKK